ncbi:unnamed protein product [Arabidopsis lyrata]|nr:unnamed protein product [Arabidopsis lyrata]
MTRKKVKVAYISNNSSRKATFKKRKKGLMKKVNELSTLCGINACAIIYSPYDSNPEVWPSNSGVQRFEILQNSGIEIGESSNNVGAFSGTSERFGSMAVVASTTAPTHTTIEAGSSSSFPAFLNPIQQQQQHPQFRHQSSPQVGFYEKSRSLNLNLNDNHNQNQQKWFMEMMNHPDQLNYAAEQKGFPFMDDNHHNNNHHDPHQQQQIPGDSSTVSAAVSSSSTISFTNPNLTNNIWFC